MCLQIIRGKKHGGAGCIYLHFDAQGKKLEFPCLGKQVNLGGSYNLPTYEEVVQRLKNEDEQGKKQELEGVCFSGSIVLFRSSASCVI